MGFEVGPNGKVRKTKAGSTPKKNANANKTSKHAAAQSKSGKGKMTPEEVAAMKARYAAAVAANPELGKNPSGHRQGGRRTRRNRRSLRSRRQ